MRQVIDPDVYFMGWVYSPSESQRPALDVCRTERVDKKKTQVARKNAENLFFDRHGRKPSTPDERKKISRVRIMYLPWTVGNPIEYDYHEGDVFYDTKGSWIQVIHISEKLEVHSNQSGVLRAYRLRPNELASWFKNGKEPLQNQIDHSQCKREIDRLRLAMLPKREEIIF